MANEYTLPDVLERMYQNQLALEAAVMEHTLHLEQQGSAEAASEVRGALETSVKMQGTSSKVWLVFKDQ
jgi:hypothetical protein